MEIILLLLFFYGVYLFDSKVNGGAYSGSFDGMPHGFNPNAKIPNKKEESGDQIFAVISVIFILVILSIVAVPFILCG